MQLDLEGHQRPSRVDEQINLVALGGAPEKRLATGGVPLERRDQLIEDKSLPAQASGRMCVQNDFAADA
jgi:hypothetical protein